MRVDRTAGTDPGTSVHFRLQIEGIDLGGFSNCEGLSLQVEVEQRVEGGNNGFVWQLPSRITYSNVRLSRPLTSDSAKVAGFLASLPRKARRGTAQIAALRPNLQDVIAQWSLRDVIVVSWTGPTFDAGSSQVATESIELAHHGFL
ncbi:MULTISPECIES: phage tail protein [unclassified Streptomyces]|uniref:phage tail protein n=1 Tax=unclassified Streptomyces TaxID=2593676 RepID=UPI0029B0EBFF|nr:phage tail protein [Streptomyces sp. FL07-04A]MDX3575428.1 phage tail protein [Streptomyces sp. FL07-04A]